MKSFIIATVATLAGLASADLLTGQLGITSPSLGEKVPVGQVHPITWTPIADPTACPHVSIIFLKGPSTNVIPQFTIIQSTPDNGQYMGWIPDKSLPDSTEGYAIQIVCEDGTLKGGFQWSSQFGFSNPGGPSGTQSTTMPTPPYTTHATTESGYPTTELGYPTTNTTEPVYTTTTPAHTYGNTTMPMSMSTSEYPSSSGNVSYPTTTTKHHHPTHNITETTKPTKKPTKKPESTSSVQESSAPSQNTTSGPAPTHTGSSGDAGTIAASSCVAFVALVVAGFTLF